MKIFIEIIEHLSNFNVFLLYAKYKCALFKLVALLNHNTLHIKDSDMCHLLFKEFYISWPGWHSSMD